MLKLGEEQQIQTPDGREWTLGRLELRTVRAWRDYIRKQIGDPFATVDRYLGKVKDELLMPLLKEAEEVKRQLACFGMGTPLSWQFLVSEEGGAVLVGLLLKKAHPNATEDEVFEVSLAVAKKMAEVLEKAGGTVPPNAAAPAAESRGDSIGGKFSGGSCSGG
ncbi:MAG TPA: hypothetical protein VFW33_19555 [Gemmataceae bacterium]|nr:hypothetical protein [Gemmataceae bacterium]